MIASNQILIAGTTTSASHFTGVSSAPERRFSLSLGSRPARRRLLSKGQSRPSHQSSLRPRHGRASPSRIGAAPARNFFRCSRATVAKHLASARRKLNAKTREEAGVQAVRSDRFVKVSISIPFFHFLITDGQPRLSVRFQHRTGHSQWNI